ncbi:Glutamyl-tRNA(Gln) amidotransferase subunit A [Grimontia celer]|uniref:Glutamyl-tRNA(Gln) amidotransferase subunit A n=1 Tax=Grimontia celer TaxID=1796497 RepID=A0A128EX28_9GAMM|nr:amidase family protein [Grimontia celer]CZF78581.1 Glutamyl-tRNA(Gln) amidotransferase subunit A [Grimontia celer]
MVEDNFLISSFKPERQDIATGVLKRQTLVVSDCVGVRGVVTGIGVPEWSDNHEPAKNDAHVVSTLMHSGCTLIGKAQIDDFGTSISGQNPFRAKLSNPVSPDVRIGGSSSGIAVAVARGRASIGIGNDCCGGVLIPASFCNLIGYRPSQGMIDLRGVTSFSPSFDAVGIVTKQLPIMYQIAEKCWTKAPRTVRLKSIKYAKSLFHELLPIEAMLEWEVTLSESNWRLNEVPSLSKLTLTQAHNIHTVMLGREIDLQYGQWLDAASPKMTDETLDYLKLIRGKSFKEFVETKKKREFFSDSLQGFFGSGEVMMIPTSPGQAPNEMFVDDTFLINQRRLYAIAEVAGLAQITLPMLTVEGVPMGVSLLAHPGEDRLLFEAAGRLLK